MKKNRILSALLCLSLAAGLVIPGLPAYAEGEGESGSNSGMKLNKTAVANKNGTYTITLEAYATGQKVISQVNKDVPTDIVLVLDQSGSMADDIGQVRYTAYTGNNTQNKSNYEKRHNGGSANLWHKLADGSYVSVSVKKSTEYTALSASLVNYETSWGRISKNCYFYYANNLYEKVGDEYKKVELSENKSGDWYNTTYTYTYTFSDGTSISSTGRDSKPNLGSHAPLYTPAADGDSTVYTYTYTDSAGVVQTIGTSTGASTRYTPAFYQRSTTTSGGGSRLNALKSAANAFANAVAVKAAGEDGDITTTADNIDHRIAVVGYADTDWDYDYNTGVFIGNTLNRYEDAAAEVYSTALQDMSTTNAKNNVTASLNALQASGATRTDYGLIMAKGILDANPVPAGETRNRVVIVFTDGSPTSSNGFERDVANSAISTANAIKAGETTVYSIGIFSGADASTAGKEPDEDYYDGFLGPNYTDAEMSAACNWFMQKVSSNNGTPRTPSYYLSAGDSASLNSIFKQISDNIESGGTSTTLDSSAVIKDIISPQFQLPAGTRPSDITVQTVPCTGITNDVPSWGNPETFTDAAITVDANTGAVSVSGFDFAGNYVGMDNINGTEQLHNPAKKLVISFNVIPKDGFLGGNNVFTNTSAGVYENANATTPVLEFNRPQVNVPIEDVIVTPEGKNVYLLNGVTLDELKTGATVTVGKVRLDLSKENYGLEAWQNEYVDITVAITDKNGNPVPAELADLTDDTTYTVTVTVEPKSTASADSSGDRATAKSGEDEGKINIYKPELTYKDSEVFYGDDAPTDFNSNRTKTVWKHNDDVATADMGPAPDLIVTYSTEVGKIANGKINSKEDIQVKANVKIGSEDVTTYTIFAHTACAEGVTCGWNETTLDGDPAFLLHVKTATLTIKKTGDVTANEGFIFHVKCPDEKIITVSVPGEGEVTITGLPLGTYTVTEDTDWSWRYQSVSISNNGAVTLTKENNTAEVTVTNNKTNEYLLDGNAYARNNSVLSAGN